MIGMRGTNLSKLLFLVCSFEWAIMIQEQNVEAFLLNSITSPKKRFHALNNVREERFIMSSMFFVCEKSVDMQGQIEKGMVDSCDATEVGGINAMKGDCIAPLMTSTSTNKKLFSSSVITSSASMLFTMMIPSSPAMAAAELSTPNGGAGMPPLVEEGIKWIFVAYVSFSMLA
eukprot:CAMPEP_0196804682 /NCGR_PEP_ID=MMETSP1362-20130617/4350_1 /TAXON_ID=163516 /ORGANISM="Leptocylindrus danicus, Strain CCMP1856" /LENGTH=172 /DNA_ID=CAMNT_0042177141 /DNA_START=61 /DNA_END=576 /DNA_ORIENTATION=-